MDFFSLGEVFIGIGMGLGGGEMWDKHFGNMQHPNALLDNVLAQCVPRSNMVGRGSSSQFATTLKIVQLPS